MAVLPTSRNRGRITADRDSSRNDAGQLIDIELGAASTVVCLIRELHPCRESGRRLVVPPVICWAKQAAAMGSNFAPSDELAGEESYTGQHHSLSRYQHGSGEMTYRGTLRRAARWDTTKRGFNALPTM